MNIGTRVLIGDIDVIVGNPTGTVSGHGHFTPERWFDDEKERWVEPVIRPVILVTLDVGFYSPDKSAFVTVLTCDPANVHRIG